MPLLDPLSLPESGIKAVLKEAGITRSIKTVKHDLAHLLEENGLEVGEVIQTVSELMRAADSSSTRLKAAEIGAKLNGLLIGDEEKQIPVVNIIINDSQHTINPILIPREISI